MSVSGRKHYAAHPDYYRARHLRKYGLTIEQYEQMVRQQGGLCAICHKTCNTKQRLCVDHCHHTGEIRGLLCRRCNCMLEWFLGYASDIDGYLTQNIEGHDHCKERII